MLVGKEICKVRSKGICGWFWIKNFYFLWREEGVWFGCVECLGLLE